MRLLSILALALNILQSISCSLIQPTAAYKGFSQKVFPSFLLFLKLIFRRYDSLNFLKTTFDKLKTVIYAFETFTHLFQFVKTGDIHDLFSLLFSETI